MPSDRSGAECKLNADVTAFRHVLLCAPQPKGAITIVGHWTLIGVRVVGALDTPSSICCLRSVHFWWVNQNQTFRQETQGGYLWSPKRNQGDGFNTFYDNMRGVAPGDLVFSFCDTLIRAVGIAHGNCYECPKPAEFGSTGRNWSAVGWRVDVRFTVLANQIRPKDHMAVIGPTLPLRYSPLQANGNGNQGVYLAEVPDAMATVLSGLIGAEVQLLAANALEIATDEKARATVEAEETRAWEEHLVEEIKHDVELPETDRRSLVMARRGQGLFRERVAIIEKRCRLTGVDRPGHLIASHAKPWRDSVHAERLNGENGLLLTPTIDHLFDRGFISFEDGGDLLVSPVAHTESLMRMGVDASRVVNVGSFSSGQKHFLDFHRANVFLARRVAKAG